MKVKISFFLLTILIASCSSEVLEPEEVCPCTKKYFIRTTFACDNTNTALCYTDQFSTQEASCEADGETNRPGEQTLEMTWYRIECT